MDQAVYTFGTLLETELDKAGHKPGKEERQIVAARKRVMDRVLGADDAAPAKGRFRDPMTMLK